MNIFEVSAAALGSRPKDKLQQHKWEFPADRSTARRRSTHRVKLFIGQVPRHDGHRNRKSAHRAAQMGDQRPRSLAINPCGEHQHGDVLVFLDQFQDFCSHFAFADHAFWSNAGYTVGARRESCQHGVGFLKSLGSHDVGDAQPLLTMIAGFDDTKHDYADPDPGGATARIIHGTVAFWRVVDDHQELRLVTDLVAPSLTAHRTGSSNLLGLPPPGIVIGASWCNGATTGCRSTREAGIESSPRQPALTVDESDDILDQRHGL